MKTEDKRLILLTYITHFKKDEATKIKRENISKKGGNNYKNTQQEIKLDFKLSSKCS